MTIPQKKTQNGCSKNHVKNLKKLMERGKTNNAVKQRRAKE
jgi:hypothetical protein